MPLHTTYNSGDGSYTLADATLPTTCHPMHPDVCANGIYNADFSAQPASSETLYRDVDNVWGTSELLASDADPTTPAGQTTAADAAFGVEQSWRYFLDKHGRVGPDGLGSAIITRIHYDTPEANRLYPNAFWDTGSYSMSLGDGDFGLSMFPLVTLDIIGHEFTHGVTDASAGLLYFGESGGLNESTSDIFGNAIERFGMKNSGHGTPSWGIGEQASDGAAWPVQLRFMHKPSLDGQSPDVWHSKLYLEDPHLASGPMNRAFYFLSEGASADPDAETHSPLLAAGMEGIGEEDAAAIWYRALTTYLVPTSTYLEARTAALRAAIDLFESPLQVQPSLQRVAVRKAFGAVNVGDPNDAHDDFTAPNVEIAGVTSTGSQVFVDLSTSDDEGVRHIDLYVDNYLAAVRSVQSLVPDNALSISLDATTLKNGSHTVFAVVHDAGGNSSDAPSPVDFETDSLIQQMLLDPSFESGCAMGWALSTCMAQVELAPRQARTGDNHLQFSSYSVDRVYYDLSASQSIDVPMEGKTTLELYVQLLVLPGEPNADESFLNLSIVPLQTGVSHTLDTYDISNFPYSDATARPSVKKYEKRAYDLSSYAGQTIELKLAGHAGSQWATFFFVDDVTVVNDRASIFDDAFEDQQ